MQKSAILERHEKLDKVMEMRIMHLLCVCVYRQIGHVLRHSETIAKVHKVRTNSEECCDI